MGPADVPPLTAVSALGAFVLGVFALGVFAFGVFALGVFAFGVFALGVFALGVFALGVFVGSLVNVVVDRVPPGEPTVRRIRVPVRYPLVELGTGAAFVAVAVRLEQLGLRGAVPAFLYFTAIGIALSLIDLDVRRLPNAIVLPSYPVLAVALTGSAWWRHDWSPLARAGTGAAALLVFFGALWRIHPAGMGLGDVKLSGLIGGVLGYLSWTALMLGAFLGFLLGAVLGVTVMATGRGTRKTPLPFGPFMVMGALLALFLSGG